jgi:hypothetical protein
LRVYDVVAVALRGPADVYPHAAKMNMPTMAIRAPPRRIALELTFHRKDFTRRALRVCRDLPRYAAPLPWAIISIYPDPTGNSAMSYRMSKDFKKNADSLFAVIRLRQVYSRELSDLLPTISLEIPPIKAAEVLEQTAAGSECR